MSEPTTSTRTGVQLWLWILSAIVWFSPAGRSQIADQVIVFPDDSSTSHAILRFDRKLNLIGATDAEPSGNLTMRQAMGVDGTGLYSISFDSINTKKLLRMTSGGQFQPSVLLNNNPVSLTLSMSGTVYALTRIPLTTTGPAYGVSSNGTVLWKNADLASKYFSAYAEYPAVTPDGRLWVDHGTQWLCGCGLYHALLAQLDTITGAVLRTIPLPDTGTAFGNETFVTYLAASPDGTLWSGQSGSALVHVDLETGTKTPYWINGGYNGKTSQLRVDASGDVWAVETVDNVSFFGKKLLKVSAATGKVVAVQDIGAFIRGFALGAAGEDMFVVSNTQVPPFPVRMSRVNLVSGVTSSIPLESPINVSAIPNGDPTGFVYANVIDQEGDNDGDGWTNRAETLAGSSPFDPNSRPNGPNVYVSFNPVTNAIRLNWRDPDGLFDPVGGLSVPSISLQAGGYGEVMKYLWPFLTSVVLSPDGKQATIELGGLPLPLGLRVPLEARIADKTGATAWDWQVTPPGDL